MPNQEQELAYAKELFKRLGISPDDIENSERPDLVFNLEGVQHGLEITECTPEEYRRGSKLAQDIYEKTGQINFHSVSTLNHRDQRRKNPELMHDMFNNREWVSMDESRQVWVQGVIDCVNNKRNKFNKPASIDCKPFDHYEKNWLLVWDGAHSLGNDSATAAGIQCDILNCPIFVNEHAKDFDEIYVIAGDYTFGFRDGQVAFFHERPDEMNKLLNPSN